jgi:hypothetical protein
MRSCVQWLQTWLGDPAARPSRRHCEEQSDEAIQLSCCGKLDCFASLAMTEDTTSHSRRALRPRLAIEFPYPPYRGRRECRVRAAPAVSCASSAKKCAHEHTGERRTLRHPLRNGFTAYNVLSPVNGFFATVAGGILPANLTPASRRQDHTTSPYASAPFVKSASASTASHPALVTIANAPRTGTGRNRYIADLGLASSEISGNQKFCQSAGVAPGQGRKLINLPADGLRGPLCRWKRTFALAFSMSALCQQATFQNERGRLRRLEAFRKHASSLTGADVRESQHRWGYRKPILDIATRMHCIALLNELRIARALLHDCIR